MVGQTISHYKVLEKIGEGGMGEVYRATDTKLNRDVALKILPEQFASDSQRMGRFQREAEVLASLDHPNIGQIYGIEEAGQTKALVLQLIEGPTLAERIAQGPIPVEDALKIALQMAEGLEAAHEKGVIHRVGWLRPWRLKSQIQASHNRQHSPLPPPRLELFWVRRPTCPPNRLRGRLSINERTSLHLVLSCMNA
jgi:hypothetical protein